MSDKIEFDYRLWTVLSVACLIGLIGGFLMGVLVSWLWWGFCELPFVEVIINAG